VTSTGSYSATAAMRSSASWVMQMATFRAQRTRLVQPGAHREWDRTEHWYGERRNACDDHRHRFSVRRRRVKFGGTTATGVTVTNSTTITATTPAHTAGAVDVVVTNSDGKSGTLTGGFTYTGSISGL